MFGTAEISKLRNQLTRLLRFGESGRWVQLERADKTPLLTFEIIAVENLDNVSQIRDWDMERFIDAPTGHALLMISDSKTEALLAIIERGKELPTPLFPAVHKYYDEARALNTISYRSLFPGWDTHIIHAFMVFYVFTLFALVFFN